ncbi:hypothetical protein BGZ60DRAFT_67202 [Tricladium varicosporioides]|nr:hypothetical protein BGZ60DRAFT_67202 [Hymenoscyphus varicosporioides]
MHIKMRIRRSSTASEAPFFSLRALYRKHSSSGSKKHHRRRHSHSHHRHHHSSHLKTHAPSPHYQNYPTHYPSHYEDYYHPQEPPPYYHRPSRNRTTPLENLPPELKRSIHSHLTPLSSTMLGLSTPHLYRSHTSTYPHTSLYDTSPDYGLPLAFQLRKQHDRIIPKGYILDPYSGKLVSKDGYRESRRERRRRKEYEWEWQRGMEEREREMERLWGREGRLGTREEVWRDMDVAGTEWSDFGRKERGEKKKGKRVRWA